MCDKEFVAFTIPKGLVGWTAPALGLQCVLIDGMAGDIEILPSSL